MLPTVTGAAIRQRIALRRRRRGGGSSDDVVVDGYRGGGDGGGAEGYTLLGAVLECHSLLAAAAACYLKANWTILSSYSKLSYTIKNQS